MQSGGGYHRAGLQDALQGQPEAYGDVSGLDGFHIEVKRQERYSIRAWMKQAEQDANPRDIPLVVFRANNEEWSVALDFTDFLMILTGEKP